jgi:hypothetical protein
VDGETSDAIGGPLDATAVMASWCLRRSFYPLLWSGIAIALVVGGTRELDVRELESPSELTAALFSPLVGLALAIVVRLLAGAVSWAAAWALVTSRARSVGLPGLGLRTEPWRDRALLARSYAAWRWTSPVRRVAVERGRAVGSALQLLDRVLVVANPVLLVGSILAIALWAPPPGS